MMKITSFWNRKAIKVQNGFTEEEIGQKLQKFQSTVTQRENQALLQLQVKL